MVKELEQVVAEEKCLLCGSVAQFVWADEKNYAVYCSNANCHWTFGFTIPNEKLLQMSEDAILSLEVIGD